VDHDVHCAAREQSIGECARRLRITQVARLESDLELRMFRAQLALERLESIDPPRNQNQPRYTWAEETRDLAANSARGARAKNGGSVELESHCSPFIF